MTLAERLAEAESAESGPRKQVMALTSAYEAAVASADHAEAARILPVLSDARQELLIAEATVTALRSAQEEMDRQRQAELEAASLARDVEAAREERDRCLAARTRAQESSAATRALIPGAIEAVQKLIAEALGFDRQAAAADTSAVAAMVRTGERAPGSGSHVAEPTKALLDRDETLRLVQQWTGAALPGWMVGSR